VLSNTQALHYQRVCTTPQHVPRLNVTFYKMQLRIVFDGKPDTIDHK